MTSISFLFLQVNKTLTNVTLNWNNLGPEGGEAIAKSLGVTFHVHCYRALSLSLYDSELDFPFWCVLW